MINVRMTDEAIAAGVDPALIDLFREQLQGDWKSATLDINPFTKDLRVVVRKDDLTAWMDAPATLVQTTVKTEEVIHLIEEQLEQIWKNEHAKGRPRSA